MVSLQANTNLIMNIPTGNNNEELKQRKDIISQLYRHPRKALPTKSRSNTY